MNIMAVARKAGVSTATVSRTINGFPHVNPKTAERVFRAIEELGYYPDINARALGSGKSSLYGLIISDITNPFFPELVKAFEDVAVRHKKEILIANTNYDPIRMEHCVERMLQRKVDGVAIMTSEMDDRLVEIFRRRKIPMVFLDTMVDARGMSSIRVDYSRGIGLAVDHLVALGHRQIAYLCGPEAIASARLRYQAYEAALRRHQLPLQQELVSHSDHRVEGGFAAMQTLLDSGANFSAVVCSNDLSAIGAIQAIHHRGLRIPQDISVVGFDNIQLSAYTHPQLTTVGIERTMIAELAFSCLLNVNGSEVEGLPQAEHTIVPTLVVRESTAPKA